MKIKILIALLMWVVPVIAWAEIRFGSLPAASTKASAPASVDVAKAGCAIRTYVPNQPMIPPEFGSGVNTDSGVLTCYHVIQLALAQGKTIEVECDGEKSVAVVTFQDAANDIAVLRPKWQRDHVKLSIESNRPKIGDKVQTACRLRNGIVGSEKATVNGSSFDGKITIDLATTSGMSGGGVANSDGKLIGIISGNIAIEPFQGLVIPLRQAPGYSSGVQVQASQRAPAAAQASGPRYEIQCNGRHCRKVRVQ